MRYEKVILKLRRNFKAIGSRITVWPTGLVEYFSIVQAGLPSEGIQVFYGHDRLPTPDEVAHGGIIKFQRLNEFFPNASRRFNILYMVSSNRPAYAWQLVRAARQIGAKFVWNQNGVAYPAWLPSGWEKVNAEMAKLLHAADHIFYQSEFSRTSSNKFLGRYTGSAEILYNAVDTNFFHPAPPKKEKRRLVLLTAGSKDMFERIESPIRALAHVRKYNSNARLVFAGRISENLRPLISGLIAELALEEHVTFLPPFTQEETPKIFQQADIFIHPKLNDPCPGVVIEAMACGLPTVFSDSGGTPELVGSEAGVGVPTKLSWEQYHQPKAEAWAEAVLTVAEAQSRFAEAARQRAVERFDLKPWIERHKQLFSELLG